MANKNAAKKTDSQTDAQTDIQKALDAYQRMLAGSRKGAETTRRLIAFAKQHGAVNTK